MNRDPIGMGDSVNLYEYVGDSPMGGRDPSGRFVQFIIPAIIIGVPILILVWVSLFGTWKDEYPDKVRVGTLKKDAQDQTNKFNEQKKEAREAIQKEQGYWGKNWTASTRSFNEDNIKFDKSWQEVSYDQYEWYPLKPYIPVVIIYGQEATPPELWNYMVGYNARYAGKTLNDPNGNFLTDTYRGGLFTEEWRKWKTHDAAENNEEDDRPWYAMWYYDANWEIEWLLSRPFNNKPSNFYASQCLK